MQANQNGQENTISLKVGTYTLRAIDNNVVGPEGLLEGPNGLPSITGKNNNSTKRIGRNHRKGSRGSAVSSVSCRQRRQSESIWIGAEIRARQLRLWRGCYLQSRHAQGLRGWQYTRTPKTTGPGFHTVGGAGISNRGQALILQSEF